MSSAPRVPLIFGTMTIGEPGKNGVRTDTLGKHHSLHLFTLLILFLLLVLWFPNDRHDVAQQILNVFFKHGGKELDTAR
jgi:aflatoxin B1 aldehyde reductase